MSRFDVDPGMRPNADLDDSLTSVSDESLSVFLDEVRLLAAAPAPAPAGDLAVLFRDGFEPSSPQVVRPASPRRASAGRWASRAAVLAAPLGMKLAAAATAAAATFGGAAALGVLPDDMQQWVSDVAATVNVGIPDGSPAALRSVTSRAADKARSAPAAPELEPPQELEDLTPVLDVDDEPAGGARDADDAREDRRGRQEDAADEQRDREEDAADEQRDRDEDAADDARDAAEDDADDAEDAARDTEREREDAADEDRDQAEDDADDRDDAAEDAQDDAEDAVDDAEDALDGDDDGDADVQESDDDARDDADDAQDDAEDAADDQD